MSNLKFWNIYFLFFPTPEYIYIYVCIYIYVYIYCYIYIYIYIYIYFIYVYYIIDNNIICMYIIDNLQLVCTNQIFFLQSCDYFLQITTCLYNLSSIFWKWQLFCKSQQFSAIFFNASTKIRSLMEASPHPTVVSNCQTKSHMSYSFIYPANGLLFHSTLGGSVCDRGDACDAVAMKLRPQEKNVGVKSVITIRMIKIKVNITITVIIMKEQ